MPPMMAIVSSSKEQTNRKQEKHNRKVFINGQRIRNHYNYNRRSGSNNTALAAVTISSNQDGNTRQPRLQGRASSGLSCGTANKP